MTTSDKKHNQRAYLESKLESGRATKKNQTLLSDCATIAVLSDARNTFFSIDAADETHFIEGPGGAMLNW